MATAGSIVIDLLMRTGAFETDSKRAEKRLKELQKTATDAGKVLGTAIVAGATAAVTALKLTIDSMDEMSKAAKTVGLSTEEFSKLAYAADLANVSTEELQAGLGRLVKAQAASLNVTSQQAKIFEALGISTKNADGSLRQTIDVMYDFADVFATMKDKPEALAAGLALFGRGFQTFVPLIEQGSGAIREAGKELESFGGVLSNEAGQNAEEFNDNLTRLQTAAKSLALAVASDLLPDLVNLSAQFVGSAKDGERLAETASSIADVFRTVGTAIQFGANVFVFFKNQVDATVGVLVGLNTTLNGILNLNFDRFRAGIATVFSAVGIADDLGNSGTAPVAQRATAGRSRRGGGPMNLAPAFDNSAALRAALGGGTGGGGKGKGSGSSGPSKAQQEAEQLDKAYESLKANLEETYALFNDNTEAAKVLYDTQNGELAKLSQARKDELVTLAQRNDLQKESNELADAASDRLKDEVDSMERHSKAVKEQIADMQFENELIGLTNIAKEKAIALRYANVDAMSEEGQKITGLIDEYHKLNDSYGFVNDTIDGLGDAFASFADRTKSAKEAFGDWADDLYSTAIKWLSDQAMNALKEWLSGKQDGNGGYGGAKEGGFDLGSLVSSVMGFFGGGKAGGGDVLPGRGYLVGEGGPEMFMPRTAGTIIPAAGTASMGKGGTVFNQSNTWIVREGNPQRTQEQTAQKMGQKVEEITRRNK